MESIWYGLTQLQMDLELQNKFHYFVQTHREIGGFVIGCVSSKIKDGKRMKISVIVHPNAKKSRIEKDLLESLHVYVHEPPLEGKANKAVVEALATYFGVKKTNVLLLSGDKSKIKLFEIIFD